MERSEIQLNALTAWKKSNKKGTLEMATGTGKTIAALMCLSSMPKNDGKVHLFLAETNQREVDLEADILLYNKLFNTDLRRDYKLVFKCYQGVYNLEGYDFGLVIGDEIHNGLTPEYVQFFINNKYDAIVCLSATVERSTKYELENGSIITKGDYLDHIAPVCFKYTMKNALEDEIGRPIDIFLVGLSLNNTDKTVKAGSKTKPFYQTEQGMYDYLDKNYKKSFFMNVKSEEERSIMIKSRYKWRSDFLNNLPSKYTAVKRVMDSMLGKSILFGTSIEAMLKITPNVVSSKNKPEVNEKIREDFNNDVISLIGSFKMLRQGANLKKIRNCVLMSYFGLETHIVQQVGRLRKDGNIKGRVIIFYFKNTIEEETMLKLISFLQYDKCYHFEKPEDLLKQIYLYDDID